MEINWLQVGYELARLIVFTVVGLVSGALLFRQYVAPSILTAIEQLDKADETITNLAKLAGVKSQEFTAAKNLEKLVSDDLIKSRIPEMEAVRLVVSEDTWDKIEEAMERNPEAVMALYEKYKHHFVSPEGSSKLEFDF